MKLFKRLTLATRLALFFALAATIIFAGAVIHLYHSSSEHLRERDEVAMMDCLDLLRHYIQVSPSVEALQSNEHTLLDVALAQRGVSFAVWTSGGEIIRASTLEARSLPLGERANARHTAAGSINWTMRHGNQTRVMATTVQVGNGAEEVQLAVAHNDKALEGMLRAYRTDLLSTALVGTLAIAVLGYAIARQAMRPIKTIARASSEITASHLNERLRVEDAPPELGEMVRAFNEMLNRLEDSFGRLGQFSSDIAHDLRTPLSNLMVETQVALTRPRSGAEYEVLLASNIEELERLSGMVEDMLFLARVDNPSTVIDRSHVDLRAELDEVAEYYGALAQERDLSIQCEGEAAVTGDRALLQRAIHNLISNAVRYATPGGVVEASISRKVGEPWVDLSITNPSSGIAPEHLPRVFDRFYRADSARQKDGTGLGLAIVKSIVQLHGGEVRVASEADKKTTFVVRLPAFHTPMSEPPAMPT